MQLAMRVDQGVATVSAYEQVIAAMERGITAPVAGRTMAARWSRKTAETYLSEVRMAREWWESERRTARESAQRAGLERIPEGDVAQFMPWDSDRLGRYAAHLVQTGRAPATIGKALSALRAWHRLHGLPVPDGTAALTVVQEHEHNLERAGWEPRRAEPITLDTAVRLLASCDRARDRGRRDACLLMLGFAGMLSTERLSWLTIGDVRLSVRAGEALPALALRRRDDDGSDGPAVVPRPRRHRPHVEWVDVPHWRISGEHLGELCPVEVAAGWLGVLLALEQGSATPMFRPIDRWGNIGGVHPAFAGGLAMLNEGGRLGPREIGEVLRAAAERAGIPDEQRPTMTELRLGGVVRRRLDGATVDELEAASGLATLLEHVRAAERRAAS